ncbi:transposase [Streptomyces phyllanthi]|uniref:Transposase n=1 Tax=Streptomyces phyllanthi TaxID=1803180 RepID=A0A5N8W6U8_9ACTN|nr:transposase [Streptomyces phyllanthi]
MGGPAGEPADHAIGRSRGGLTTRIHLAAVARCRPLAFVLTAGQAGDAPAFTDVMARLRVPRRRGRPRTRPDVVLADKAYSSRAIRDHLRKRGIRAVIPVPADQRGHRLRRGSRGRRPPAELARKTPFLHRGSSEMVGAGACPAANRGGRGP